MKEVDLSGCALKPGWSDSLPVPIAVISSGKHVEGHKKALDPIWSDQWHYCDVAAILKNVDKTQVNHNWDGTHPSTVVSIYANSKGFAKIFIDEMKTVLSKVPKLIDNECSAGRHRSDVFSRTQVACLNSMRTPAGQRIFNAWYFPLNECAGVKDMVKQLQQATRWADTPWTLAPGSDPLNQSSLYAHDPVMKNQAAWTAFTKVWKFMRTEAYDFTTWVNENDCEEGGVEVIDVDSGDGAAAIAPAEASGHVVEAELTVKAAPRTLRGSVGMAPAPTLRGSVEKLPAAKRFKVMSPQAKSSSKPECSPQPKLTAQPPKNRPPEHVVVAAQQQNVDSSRNTPQPPKGQPPEHILKAAAAAQKENVDSSKGTPQPPKSQPPRNILAAAAQQESVDNNTGSGAPCNLPADNSVGRPPWATSTFSVEHWWDVLQSYDVDLGAIMSLYLLAQLNDDGKVAANGIINDLIREKKKNNPSNWVRTRVATARFHITQ